MRGSHFVFAFLAVITPASSVFAQSGLDFLSGGRHSGKELEQAIESAAVHPLGSEMNPVRVDMPLGQRAYLARLRCGDNKVPKFQRAGNVGPGPFGSIVDLYEVNCGEAAPGKVSVYMDMYHPQHKEQNPVPGFQLSTE